MSSLWLVDWTLPDLFGGGGFVLAGLGLAAWWRTRRLDEEASADRDKLPSAVRMPRQNFDGL